VLRKTRTKNHPVFVPIHDVAPQEGRLVRNEDVHLREIPKVPQMHVQKAEGVVNRLPVELDDLLTIP
jgi:hypothetical protein